MRKKLKIPSELAYATGILTLSFAVAMMSAANFGLSMVVAPAYILSRKLELLTFGQCEYILQALVFILFCILMRRIKLVYFFSFLTCLIYGAVLDLWRRIIPAFNPAVTVPGAFPLALRILFFAAGMLLTAFSVALFFKTYLYPQVYDFFVKFVSARYGIDRTKFKRLYDASSLTLAAAMTLLFFRRFVGIGWGTLVMALFNGLVIGFFDRKMDLVCAFVPLWPKLAERFAIQSYTGGEAMEQTTNEPRIERATDADKGPIMALYRSMIGTEGCTWNADYPNMELLERDLAAGNVFVLRDDAGGIRATIAVDYDEEVEALPVWSGAPGEYQELARLCVRQEEQSRGIARQMLVFGMRELKRRGCIGVHFLVSPHNPRALASYAKLDFRNLGAVSLYDQDWYCYEKRFDEDPAL